MHNTPLAPLLFPSPVPSVNSSNFNFFDRFECDRGYLLRGSTVSVCEDDGDGDDLGVWSEDAPVCIRIRCEPPHIAPDNGILRSCSDENYLNSVCR